MKTILVNVYNRDKELLSIWREAKFNSFQKSINGGLGACTLDLAVPFDFGSPELTEGNEVEILVGKTIVYYGHIAQIIPWANHSGQGIKVLLLGPHTKLNSDILKNSNQTTLYTHTTSGLTTVSDNITLADTGTIIEAIIDRYIAENDYPAIIKGNIETTGQDMEYIFEMMNYREALDKVLSASPIDYFWYVGADKKFHFKTKPSTPTHAFIYGRHFSEITVRRNSEKIRNSMLFWNGEIGANKIFKFYEDTESVVKYGRRIEKYFDWGVGNEATADAIADRFIKMAKETDIEVVCDIMGEDQDNYLGYDIENIQPGETCRFVGFNERLARIFREDNMLITDVRYALDRVTLTIKVRRAGIIDWQNELSRKATENYSRNAPETYSV